MLPIFTRVEPELVSRPMAVIAHLEIPAESFELGRILEMESGTTLELENMVPLGEKAVPFFSISEDVRQTFEETVRDHPSVEGIEEISRHEDTLLYSLDWNVARDVFFQGILETEAHILGATGGSNVWEFEIRFPTHEGLNEFQEFCSNAHIGLTVNRIYNPTKPSAGMWYGLTVAQRDAILLAVDGGYYSIPRRMSTQDLADELGISDQAVTERLRRAIVTLVENTLAAMEEESETAELTRIGDTAAE